MLQYCTDNRTMKGQEGKNSLSIKNRNLTPNAIFFLWPLQIPSWEHGRANQQNCCNCLNMSSLDMGHSSRNLLHAALCLHQPDTFSYLLEELAEEKAESQHGTTRGQARIQADNLFIPYTSPCTPGPQPHYRVHSS